MDPNFIENIILSLPINFRLKYILFKYLSPNKYKHYQQMRTIITKSDCSYKPFDDLRCIFVHVPKCAGISICKTFFGNRAGAHTLASQYQLIFHPKEFSSYFKFTIVRNPWDRLVSAYHFLKNEGFDTVDRKWAYENLSCYNNFHEFVKFGLNKREVRKKNHFMPQIHYLTSLWRKSSILVDFVCYYENLEKDILHVSRKLGISTSPLPKLNPSIRSEYTQYYNAETIDIVSKIYRDDIKFLGYDYDNSRFN